MSQVIAVDKITNGSALTHVAKLIFHKRGLETRLGLPQGVLMRYAAAVQDQYSCENPFTNSTHGALPASPAPLAWGLLCICLRVFWAQPQPLT